MRRAEPASGGVRGHEGPGRRQAHRVSRRRSRVPLRGIAPRAGADSREALRVQVQRVLHDEPADRLHRARQFPHRRARGAAHGRPAGRLPQVPGLPRRARCSTSPTTSNAAGPVVGFRTATHAFQIKRADAKFLKYHWQTGDEYKGGFGRQILGETWVSHYGTNHKQSSRLLLQADQAAHPILRGVKDVWAQSGGYMAHPIEGSQVLATGQILDGMTPDAPPAPNKDVVPVAWYRTLHQPVRQIGTRVHDHARRVGGSAERRLPADVRQRRACGRPVSRRAFNRPATSASSVRISRRPSGSAGTSRA